MTSAPGVALPPGRVVEAVSARSLAPIPPPSTYLTGNVTVAAPPWPSGGLRAGEDAEVADRLGEVRREGRRARGRVSAQGEVRATAVARHRVARLGRVEDLAQARRDAVPQRTDERAAVAGRREAELGVHTEHAIGRLVRRVEAVLEAGDVPDPVLAGRGRQDPGRGLLSSSDLKLKVVDFVLVGFLCGVIDLFVRGFFRAILRWLKLSSSFRRAETLGAQRDGRGRQASSTSDVVALQASGNGHGRSRCNWYIVVPSVATWKVRRVMIFWRD